MKVVITSLTLKNPFKFFVLANYAMLIRRQLKNTTCKQLKTSGFWLTHYTMTLWEEESAMKAFASSGAHLESMKKSKLMAKEIRTKVIDADTLPDWRKARQLLKNGKVLTFKK